MTIKVTEKTEKIIAFLKTRLGSISNVRAVEHFAITHLELIYKMYQETEIDKDDEWRMNSKESFYEFLDEINYKPVG